MRPTLEEIGSKYGTDKCKDKHDYLRFYETQLMEWRDEPIKFVELGINNGKSLRTWEEWFTKAEIIGVDIKEKWVNQDFDRSRTVLGDCGDRAFLSQFASQERPFGLLDDASHFWSHQIAAFEECFAHIQPGGFFIMEDLNCSFGGLRRPPFNDQWVDAYMYFSKLNNYVVGKGRDHPLRRTLPESKRMRELAEWIDWMSFYRSTVFIKKRTERFSV